MSQLFAKYAAAREKYPEDIERIEQEEKRVKALLKLQEYAAKETTQELLALCRKEILFARKRLATDRTLLADPQAMEDLWSIVDSRKWFIDMVARDVEAELAIIEMGLDQELERA